MRINSTLYYILKDKLGSASVVTDSSGNTVGENRYYAYGDTRLSTGTIPTDKLFTGQREMAGLGIYNYGARFYSPTLGRFLSADTIVPGYANPQNLNRYSYVTNNPLRYTDPTGHGNTECTSQNDPACSAVNGGSTGNTTTTGGGGNGGNGGGSHGGNDPGGDIVLAPPTTIGPTETTIGPMPPTSGPSISDFVSYAYFMQFALNFMKDLSVSTRLMEKGFLWAKAINPDPRLDFILGFTGQVISDLGNPNLTLGQRGVRAGVVGLESLLTGVASDVAGASGFLLGEAVVPEGGGVVGYAGAALVTSVYLDNKVWNNYNQTLFSNLGVASP